MIIFQPALPRVAEAYPGSFLCAPVMHFLYLYHGIYQRHNYMIIYPPPH